MVGRDGCATAAMMRFICDPIRLLFWHKVCFAVCSSVVYPGC